MDPDRHPVLDRIAIDAPDFRRRMVREDGEETRDCELRLWLPVRLDNGGWVAAVRIEGLDMPPIAAMPGDDPLGALLGALAFARDLVDGEAGRVLFGDRESGGLPVFLDRGFRPSVLARVEAQARRLANDVAEDARHAADTGRKRRDDAGSRGEDRQNDGHRHERTWQIVMTGRGLEHVTPQTVRDLERFLDLHPAVSHLELEIGDDRIRVARDWPSDRFEDSGRLLQRVAASGITAFTVHDRTGKPVQRIEA